ncbi:hypothetical protein [Amycolatopsis sp. NPDC050768]|uniref:hypothetical protein n=1 Tax=Amycolatopsis sp. NPDC050768 TaxID=3154839 RepID=UPI0033DB6A3F
MQVRAVKGDRRPAGRKHAEVDVGRGEAVGGVGEGVITVGLGRVVMRADRAVRTSVRGAPVRISTTIRAGRCAREPGRT